MCLKPLKFRRQVSIPSAIALTWLFPSWATASSKALPEATAAPDIPQSKSSEQDTSVSVALPTPAPPESLPPQLSAQPEMAQVKVETLQMLDKNTLTPAPETTQVKVQTLPVMDNNTLSQSPASETTQVKVQKLR